MPSCVTGLDNLLSKPSRYIKGKRIGLVVNHTSLARDGRHSIYHFLRHPDFELAKLFGPEHGLYGVDQDMIHVQNTKDPLSGLEIISLYGDHENTLLPANQLLEDLDCLIFDIQDVGARYYTFIYTMANCMKICGETGVEMVVCDRPNPINGIQVEGNLVSDPWRSFVGQYPLPNRHGMTAGELALMFQDQFGLDCKLTLIPVENWDRNMWFEDTGLIWVAPSPNMPRVETACVYPGMCIVEGTHLSEGRGTTLPFEQVGAPYIDPFKLKDALDIIELPGVIVRPHFFKPTFQKWAQKVCGGIQLHVTDRSTFQPVWTGLAVIHTIARMYPEHFEWRTEPYEFVSDRLAIDLLYGNTWFRENWINRDLFRNELDEEWQEELDLFKQKRQDYLIY